MLKFYNPGEALQSFVQSEALRCRNISREALLEADTLEKWEKRREYIKEKLLESIGGLPEKIDLKTSIERTIHRDCYTIENILLESLPGMYVNLNLYLPVTALAPFPAVIFTTGHDSKCDPVHQYPVQGLVRLGYAVAVFDSPGRGERSFGNEHFEVGPLSWLNHKCMERYFIHDSICVTDYLCSRNDIDIGRIGATGVSGGGNTAIFHAALDQRIKCVVPVCTVASLTDYALINYTGCPEYFPIGLLGYGLDIQDLLCLIAPRPLLFIGGEKDIINSISSMQEACSHAARIYRLYGREDDIGYLIDAGQDHGYHQSMRQAMYGWMQKHITANPGGVFQANTLEDGYLEKREDLEFISDCGKTLKELEYEQMASLSCEAGSVLDRATLMELLGLKPRLIKWSVLSTQKVDAGQFEAEKSVLETESGIPVPLIALLPNNFGKKAKLMFVLSDTGRGRLLSPNEFGEYLNKGYIIFAADLRGTGLTRPEPAVWDLFDYCSIDRALSGVSIALGYPIAGQRVYDALAVMKYMRDKYGGGNEIKIYGEGHAAITAWLISLLEPFNELVVHSDMVPFDSMLRKHEEKMKESPYGIMSERSYKYYYSDIIPGICKYK